MRTNFDQARDALAFLEYHRLEPSALNYGTALAHLSEAYRALSGDVAASIDKGELNDARFAELGREYAAAIAETGPEPDAAEMPADGGSIAERLATTERDVAQLREQVAALLATVERGHGGMVDAEHDELTHALNQTGARRVLDKIAAQDQRYVLVMFGIDRLVAINRQYGNSVGDNILNAFANKLSNTFPEHEAIRWAGNEFIVAIPGQTRSAVLAQAEEALLLLERRKFKLRGSGEAIGKVTASAAMVADQNNDVQWVIEEARAKLQGAMLAGGNRVVA